VLNFKKILCPIDFDRNSTVALQFAVRLTRESGGSLHLIHVVRVPAGPEVAIPYTRLETQARRRLGSIARSLKGKCDYELDVMSGDPAGEILAAAQRIGADLIVIATHGRRGIRRIVLGSVAEQVIREAICPVLTINPAVKAPSPGKPTRRRA
jgi:universal stress protein A